MVHCDGQCEGPGHVGVGDRLSRCGAVGAENLGEIAETVEIQNRAKIPVAVQPRGVGEID